MRQPVQQWTTTEITEITEENHQFSLGALSVLGGSH